MHIYKRAVLYLARKKGKNLLLCIVFLLVSFSLLIGSTVYSGIQQVSKDLRSSIGASFGAILKKWTAKYERGIIIKKERITWKTPSIQRNSSKA